MNGNTKGTTTSVTKEKTITELIPGYTYNVYAEVYDVAGNMKRTPAEGTVNITTEKLEGKINPPTAKTLTYNRAVQELINAATSDTGTVQYKLGEDGTYSTTIPTATNAGTYKVYYKVIGDIHHKDVPEASIDVTIGQYDVNNCTIELSATSYNSAHAGGIAGALFSYGSDYLYDGSDKDDDPLLSSESDDFDIDIMIIDSFAVAELYSNSTAFNSRAGYIIADCNMHANIKNCYYPSNIEVPIVAVNNPDINTDGTGVPASVFKNAELLTDTCGFDFENTWTFVSDYDYPVLKCMVTEKELLKIVSAKNTNGTLDIALQVLESDSNYTVVIGVYNKRNQLISFDRKQFAPSELINEFLVSHENMKSAHHISVSVFETTTMRPLFDALKYNM